MGDDQRSSSGPKIPSAEALLVGALILLADILDYIPGVGLGVTDAIAFPSEQIYMRTKGVKGNYALIGNLLELIPVVGDVLPLRTAAFLVTIYVDRHPKSALAATALKVGFDPKVQASARSLGAAARSKDGAAWERVKNVSREGRQFYGTVQESMAEARSGQAAGATTTTAFGEQPALAAGQYLPSQRPEGLGVAPMISDRGVLSADYLSRTSLDTLKESMETGVAPEDVGWELLGGGRVRIDGSVVDLSDPAAAKRLRAERAWNQRRPAGRSKKFQESYA
ncbi:MAG: hypothetical protein HY978_01405 [Candidatus Liptonbacteria bacterium]|nr:hypothetical protein [Candidatus Liptonbacteria bacterium]